MKIYDCFTFYNELDLLDIRLKELHNAVDHFVIVEATTTFQNKPKALYLKDNWDRYAQYHDKIIHVVVEDMPLAEDPWSNERFQRDAIMRGLVDANPADLAIIGDVDEIIRAEVVARIRRDPAQIYGFRMPYFNFKFNYMLIDNWETYCVWTMASRVGLITSPEELRRTRQNLNSLEFGYVDDNVEVVEHAGWHFTYLGNSEFVKNKITSFSHNELNDLPIDVDDSIKNNLGFNRNDPRKFVTVKIDAYFPTSIRRYTQHIIDHETASSARQYLP